jgi:hypothetical protein
MRWGQSVAYAPGMGVDLGSESPSAALGRGSLAQATSVRGARSGPSEVIVKRPETMTCFQTRSASA